MTFVIDERVHETTTTTGTGTITLGGASLRKRTISSVMTTNDRCYYVIQHTDARTAELEIGIGTLASSTTITRDIVLASSNSGRAVSFSIGSKDIFMSAVGELLALPLLHLFGSGKDGDATITGSTTLTD